MNALERLEHQDLDLDNLLKALPACRRCRANRRRCDPHLPSCRNCFKARVECIYYDHVLGEELPRSYVANLATRFKQLQQSNTPSTRGVTEQLDNSAQFFESRQTQQHKPWAYRANRYIGRKSRLAESLALGGDTQMCGQLPVGSPHVQALDLLEEVSENLVIPPRMHQFLVRTYFSTIHKLYPFVDSSLPYLVSEDASNAALSSSEVFLQQMIYSIACYCIPRDSNRFIPLAKACNRRALTHISAATAELSINTLEAVVLLALHSLFDPQKGNFGQLIGFAGRLSIDLGCHNTNTLGAKARNLYIAIYCMETKFAVTLDRPSLLPELAQPIDLTSSSAPELICSLYRLQSRIRGKGSECDQPTASPRADITALETQIEMHGQTIPNLKTTLYETQLLLGPASATEAAALLDSYADPQSIHTFLTPQWTYYAGLIILDELHRKPSAPVTLHHMYGVCLVILDRLSWRWPGATVLSESLKAYVRAKERNSEIGRDSPTREGGSEMSLTP